MSTQVPPSRLDSTKDFSSLVPSAFGRANLAFAQANASYNAANTATDSWSRAQANAGFITANSAALFANGAFDKANAAYNAANNASDTVGSYANSAFATANTADGKATSAGLYANGAFAAANSGSSASFAFAQANAAFSQANTADTKASSAGLYANGAFAAANTSANLSMTVALSDETTAITTGTAKVTFRVPYAMTLYQLPRASLATASTSGIPEVDINKNGVSIFSTLLSIDANEKTSVTAATPAVLSTTTFADDDELTFDIDVAGTGAKGLKVTLYHRRT